MRALHPIALASSAVRAHSCSSSSTLLWSRCTVTHSCCSSSILARRSATTRSVDAVWSMGARGNNSLAIGRLSKGVKDFCDALDTARAGRTQKRLGVTPLDPMRQPPKKKKKVVDTAPAGCSPKKRAARQGAPHGTQGVLLPELRAVVCVDFVGGRCYVDIQQSANGRMETVMPGKLHPSLNSWTRYWRDGGGSMSVRAGETFREALEDLRGQLLLEARIEREIF